MYNLTYSSEIGSLMGQDIEYTKLNSRPDLIDYVAQRFDLEFKGVYVYFADGSIENPAAKITRDKKEIIYYLCTNDPKSFNVFECSSYKDALEYLKGYFETSSIAYEN